MCLLRSVHGPLLPAGDKSLVREASAQHSGQCAMKTVLERLLDICQPDLNHCIGIERSAKKAGDIAPLNRCAVLQHDLPSHLSDLDILLIQFCRQPG